MSDLIAKTPFDGLDETIGGVHISTWSGFEIVSLAIAKGGREQVEQTLDAMFGLALPAAGSWTQAGTGRLLWMAPDQYFLFVEEENDRLDETLAQAMESLTYTSLQTDGWATFNLTGKGVHSVLERFIALDLRTRPVGFGTRTTAHHHPVIVMKTGEIAYRLLTPRSYARSFLTALRETAGSVTAS